MKTEKVISSNQAGSEMATVLRRTLSDVVRNVCKLLYNSGGKRLNRAHLLFNGNCEFLPRGKAAGKLTTHLDLGLRL
jgi:hypothetical protein